MEYLSHAGMRGSVLRVNGSAWAALDPPCELLARPRIAENGARCQQSATTRRLHAIPAGLYRVNLNCDFNYPIRPSPADVHYSSFAKNISNAFFQLALNTGQTAACPRQRVFFLQAVEE